VSVVAAHLDLALKKKGKALVRHAASAAVDDDAARELTGLEQLAEKRGECGVAHSGDEH